MVPVLVLGGKTPHFPFLSSFLSFVTGRNEMTLPRATVFILLAASGLAPIFHVSCAECSAGLLRIPLNSLVLACTSYAVGTAAYVTRCPKKYWAERFDPFASCSSGLRCSYSDWIVGRKSSDISCVGSFWTNCTSFWIEGSFGEFIWVLVKYRCSICGCLT